MKNRVKIRILAIFITYFFGILGISINSVLLIIGGGVPCIAFIFICLYLDLHNDKVSKWFDKTKLW